MVGTRFLMCLVLICCNCPLFASADRNEAGNGTVSVFVLAGQSNMQGQAVVDLEHEKHYNGGQGNLESVMKLSPQKYQHLKNEDGTWTILDDVLIRYQCEGELKKGGLSIGYTGYAGRHHFGPELQFGHVVGDKLEQPVLIIKTAWGGKSLRADFRPPSSGGVTGPFYQKMIGEIREGMAKAPSEFPQLKNQTLKLSGFVWFQGWNDMVDEAARSEYENNLINLIQDVRQEFGIADLPFVVGGLGNDGGKASRSIKQIRRAQAAACQNAMFKDRVKFVPTAGYARDKRNSPNITHGHHWYGNAESYLLIGEAMGNAMLDNLPNRPPRKRVLILGDSISMGYFDRVRQELNDVALVIRPQENCEGTKKGVKRIESWLQLCGGQFDIIHFNFGLHDLKHVDPETGENSNDADDPPQSTLDQYKAQLSEIVSCLKATEAKLIFATTTPVPENVKPFRDPESPQQYNQVAIEIMRANKIAVNDLYDYCNRNSGLLRVANVHFKPEGSRQLGDQVVAAIHRILADAQ